jgi:hypothetical protein
MSKGNIYVDTEGVTNNTQYMCICEGSMIHVTRMALGVVTPPRRMENGRMENEE